MIVINLIGKEGLYLDYLHFFAEKLISKLKAFFWWSTNSMGFYNIWSVVRLCQKKGLQICQDHKDKQQTSKFRFGETMGSFCEQYGYRRLTPPSREKRRAQKYKVLPPHDHIVRIKNIQKDSLILII